VDAEPAGFVLASRSRPDIGHVDDLYIRPEHRRGGLAATLLLHVARAFRERGVAHVSLDVDVGNEPARALYGRLGFTPYAQRLSAEVAALEEACRQAARPRRSQRFDR
jgi:ribosomal protein S18 acetylase RimI-like enzyme